MLRTGPRRIHEVRRLRPRRARRVLRRLVTSRRGPPVATPAVRATHRDGHVDELRDRARLRVSSL